MKPRRPYLEWARQDDEEGLAESVFKGLRSEPTVYLLPDYEDPPSQQEVLEEFWPKNRTFEMFREWFEVQMISLVQDLHLDESLECLE